MWKEDLSQREKIIENKLREIKLIDKKIVLKNQINIDEKM